MFKKGKINKVYKISIKEDKEIYSIDDLLFLFENNEMYHISVSDNKLLSVKVNCLSDIKVKWDNEEYEIITDLLKEFNNVEICRVDNYKNGHFYNFGKRFVNFEDNFIFGLILGFDEVEFIDDNAVFNKVVSDYFNGSDNAFISPNE